MNAKATAMDPAKPATLPSQVFLRTEVRRERMLADGASYKVGDGVCGPDNHKDEKEQARPFPAEGRENERRR